MAKSSVAVRVSEEKPKEQTQQEIFELEFKNIVEQDQKTKWETFNGFASITGHKWNKKNVLLNKLMSMLYDFMFSLGISNEHDIKNYRDEIQELMDEGITAPTAKKTAAF